MADDQKIQAARNQVTQGALKYGFYFCVLDSLLTMFKCHLQRPGQAPERLSGTDMPVRSDQGAWRTG
jgi:hypothetical protein